jgi:hypothetical protein
MASISANTEYLICIECSGTTVSTRTTPHPTYSDLTGGTVTQLNAVLIGGRNGLNS